MLSASKNFLLYVNKRYHKINSVLNQTKNISVRFHVHICIEYSR